MEIFFCIVGLNRKAQNYFHLKTMANITKDYRNAWCVTFIVLRQMHERRQMLPFYFSNMDCLNLMYFSLNIIKKCQF